MRLPAAVDEEAGRCAAVQVEGGTDGEVGGYQQVGQLIEREYIVGAGDKQQFALLVHCHHAAAALRIAGGKLRAFAVHHQHR